MTITPPGTPSGDAAGTSDPIGYAQALEELDAILRELEGTDVDVDRLAERVARATELIAVCRERIGAARLRIEQVVADLDDTRSNVTGPGDDDRA